MGGVPSKWRRWQRRRVDSTPLHTAIAPHRRQKKSQWAVLLLLLLLAPRYESQLKLVGPLWPFGDDINICTHEPHPNVCPTSSTPAKLRCSNYPRPFTPPLSFLLPPPPPIG